MFALVLGCVSLPISSCNESVSGRERKISPKFSDQSSHRVLQGAPPRGRQLYFTFQVLQTLYSNQEWQTKPNKGQFMNFPGGHSGTKVQCESCLLSQGKTPEIHRKMGEIHELFVLALWFGLPGRLLIKASKAPFLILRLASCNPRQGHAVKHRLKFFRGKTQRAPGLKKFNLERQY